MDRNVEVSIICDTYNHESTIRDALEGFFCQKTNFAFEILIHDDASTDHTVDIIKEYEEKYPGIIRPIYQEVNQYKKSPGVMWGYQLPRVRGKYIAMCEGDDYWTDDHKLQKQYDILESHPELDMCTHAVSGVNAKTGEEIWVLGPKGKEGVIPLRDVIDGGGEFVGTCSLFYRTSVFDNDYKFCKNRLYDYIQQILGSLRGGMYYIPEVMGVYRYGDSGSWTVQVLQDRELFVRTYSTLNKMLEELDEDTKGQFHDMIHEKLEKNTVSYYYSFGKETDGKDDVFYQWYKQISWKYKLILFIKNKCTPLYKLLKKFV